MNNNLTAMSALWKKLQANDLVDGEMPLENNHYTPWYIKVLQGFAGWVAAFFLLGFFATAFLWVFERESAFVLITLGISLNAVAYAIFRVTKANEFLHQLALVFNLCGQLMVAWGLYEVLQSLENYFFVILAIYQLFLVFIIPDFTSRVLTTWFSVFAMYISFGQHGYFYISSTLSLLAFVFVWMLDQKWGSYKPLWEPIGYGLVIALMQFNGQSLFGESLDWWFYTSNYSDINGVLFWVNEITYGLLLAGICYKIATQYKIEKGSPQGILLIAATCFLIVAGFYITGLSLAFFLLIIGFFQQRKVLMALGVLAFIGFISWYYYSLEFTLLTKSLLLMGLGLGILLGLYWLHRISSGKPLSMSYLKAKYQMDQTKWVAVVSMMVILILVNHDVYKKETILSDGKVVLLELAPVDPRSLMQGDYMRLRFSIEDSISNGDVRLNSLSTQLSHYVIVNLDENDVATFSHLDNGQELADNEVKMQFRQRHGRIKLATHAFFFQEGTASDYEPARYGEFRVDETGQLLLNNLRDESFNVLGFNRP